MVRAFGMNPKVGGSSPPYVETFSVSKTLTLSQEHLFVCRKWMLLPVHTVNISNVNFTSKTSITFYIKLSYVLTRTACSQWQKKCRFSNIWMPLLQYIHASTSTYISLCKTYTAFLPRVTRTYIFLGRCWLVYWNLCQKLTRDEKQLYIKFFVLYSQVNWWIWNGR